jgi:hypothetical protein
MKDDAVMVEMDRQNAAREFAMGMDDVPEMQEAVLEELGVPMMPMSIQEIEKRTLQRKARLSKKDSQRLKEIQRKELAAARSMDGLNSGEIVWSDSKEATKEMKKFQKVFNDYLGGSSVFGFVKNTTSRDRSYKDFKWPSNAGTGVRVNATRAQFQEAFNGVERGNSPYRIAFEVRKDSPTSYELRTFAESPGELFQWIDIDPWWGDGISAKDYRPQKTKDSLPREKGVEQGVVKLKPPVRYMPQMAVDEDTFRFKYEAKEAAKANATDIALFSETKPPLVLKGSPPKFGPFTWGLTDRVESEIEQWARDPMYGAIPFEIGVEIGEAVDFSDPNTTFPVGQGRPKVLIEDLDDDSILDLFLSDDSPFRLSDEEYGILFDRGFDEEDDAGKAKLIRDWKTGAGSDGESGDAYVVLKEGQKPEFITKSRLAKRPDGYKVPGFLFSNQASTWPWKFTKKQKQLVSFSQPPIMDDSIIDYLANPIRNDKKQGDLTWTTKRPQFKRTYKTGDGKSITFASRKAGDGLIIWNNKSSARKIADIARSRGWLMRTVPVAGGWVNLAAPRQHYQPFDSRYTEINRRALEELGVRQATDQYYEPGTTIDGWVEALNKRKWPGSNSASRYRLGNRAFYRRRR